METFEASAPGRLDVMGGIADYSGSLVLQMAIRKLTSVKVSLRNDYQCIIKSYLSELEPLSVHCDLRDFLQDGEVDYQVARSKLRGMGKDAWIGYVLGCALVLMKEKGARFQGANFFLQSDVPVGRGVSSSASVEVATMRALGKALSLSFEGTELAVLAQRAENHIVGAPCGLMDQLSSCFGAPGYLLPVLCQPDEVGERIRISDDIFFVGIDSGIKHSVGSAAYSHVRCAAFMGYSIIATSLGTTRNTLNRARNNHQPVELPYRGYLSNISVQEFEERFRKVLPESISGKEFIQRYGTTIDPVTSVNPTVIYRVLQCTLHPIFENHRVNLFKERMLSLQQETSAAERSKILQAMGTCMYQSHESYTRCGLGSAKTDEIVRSICGRPGIFGARITGGGQGGTVCVLGAGQEGYESVSQVCAQTGTTVI